MLGFLTVETQLFLLLSLALRETLTHDSCIALGVSMESGGVAAVCSEGQFRSRLLKQIDRSVTLLRTAWLSWHASSVRTSDLRPWWKGALRAGLFQPLPMQELQSIYSNPSFPLLNYKKLLANVYSLWVIIKDFKATETVVWCPGRRRHCITAVESTNYSLFSKLRFFKWRKAKKTNKDDIPSVVFMSNWRCMLCHYWAEHFQHLLDYKKEHYALTYCISMRQ